MPRKRICDAVVEVLRETDNDAITTEDLGLIGMVAQRMGWPPGHPITSAYRVIGALGRVPGELVPGYTLGFRNHRIRIFRLPPAERETS